MVNAATQFSSVLFSQNKLNTRIHIRIVSWQGSPEETRRLMKPRFPSQKRNTDSTNGQ